MNLLHICNEYSTTSLYKNLILGLHNYNYKQIVYVPVRQTTHINKNKIYNASNIKYIYSYINNTTLKYFYFRKIRKYYHDLNNKINLKQISLIHAHKVFTDGGVAYLIHQKFNIKYFIAVRSTDLDYFFKYFIHLRKFGIRILLNAQKIILLTPNYGEKLLTNYIPDKYQSIILKKFIIIPNGIDNFWLNNINLSKVAIEKRIRLIYVGAFIKRKNIETSIKVVKKLNDSGYEVRFNIIGGYGKNATKINDLARSNKSIRVLPRIRDKQILKEFYRNSDIFIMPSIRETFGLVYIEAMSQGLPLIYSKNEGIYGFFNDGEVGYAVNPFNIDDICNKILEIISNYKQISNRCIHEAKSFKWFDIAKRYNSIYLELFND